MIFKQLSKLDAIINGKFGGKKKIVNEARFPELIFKYISHMIN